MDAAPILYPGASHLVGRGVHLWYEIKADPESPTHLIVCGTKWDAATNAPYGFVSASADGGEIWRVVLEDRGSIWVTEQSCAFGPDHRAYFVSEAAKEIDHAVTDSRLGTTRLFVSEDGGQTWAERIRTGWADYSTSAVSSTSRELYTFFQQIWVERSGNREKGNALGLLVFANDGTTMRGPFFSSSEPSAGNKGIYPSDAVSLGDGTIVAMYYATKNTSGRNYSDVGIIRAIPARRPLVESIKIGEVTDDPSTGCANTFNGSLAYEPSTNTLFLIYTDGCGPASRLLLTTSNDDGHSWSKSTIVNTASQGRIQDPSITSVSPGTLGLVWRDGPSSGHWLFSVIRVNRLLEPAIELSKDDQDHRQITNDSLETWFRNDPNEAANSEKPVTLAVLTLANAVWRSHSLVETPAGVIVVWPSRTLDGMGMRSMALTHSPTPTAPTTRSDSNKECGRRDVTATTTLFYSGDSQSPGQKFDATKGNLSVCLALANQGEQPIKTPILVEAEEIKSPLGNVSVLNAENGKTGVGATWDISHSLTGNGIPPGGSSNTFCLQLHLAKSSRETVSLQDSFDLVTMKLRVFASGLDRLDCQ